MLPTFVTAINQCCIAYGYQFHLIQTLNGHEGKFQFEKTVSISDLTWNQSSNVYIIKYIVALTLSKNYHCEIKALEFGFT